MLYLSICATLLTLLAALFFLAKVKSENLGSFFRWICYLVIVVALLILGCQLSRGIMRMKRHHKNEKMECRMEEMCKHHMMMKGMKCEGRDMECCEGMENHNDTCADTPDSTRHEMHGEK